MAQKILIHPAGTASHYQITSTVLPSQSTRFTISITRPDGSILFPPIVEDFATDIYSLVHVTAEAIAAEKTFSYGHDNQPYLWNGQKWENADKWMRNLSASMHARIRSGEFRSKSSACFYNTMQAQWLASGRPELELKPFGRCEGIPIEDGVVVFNLDGESSRVPHAPEHQNLHFLPVSFQDVADEYVELTLRHRDDSLLQKFLKSSLDEDQYQVLQRWFGLHLVVHKVGNPEKLLYMFGPGGKGKSVVVGLLRNLVTDKAVATLRLRDLTIPSALEMLVGKMAMIGSEASPETDNELLKAIVSWEELTVNPKYRDPFGLRPMCLVTQASNPPPEFNDDSDAMVRRVIALEMNFQPTSQEKIVSIADKVRDQEYALLVAWAFIGAAEVMQTGTIEIPESVKKLSEKTVRPVRAVDRFVDLLEFGRFEIAENELYAAYSLFTKKQGLKFSAKKEFLQDLQIRLTRAGKLFLPRAKGTGYPAHTYTNEQGKTVFLAPELEKASSINLLLGLRIAAGEFGTAVGQPIPASRRDVPKFPD